MISCTPALAERADGDPMGLWTVTTRSCSSHARAACTSFCDATRASRALLIDTSVSLRSSATSFIEGLGTSVEYRRREEKAVARDLRVNMVVVAVAVRSENENPNYYVDAF